MAYNKQNFKDGDVLTADNLINLENGIITSTPYGGLAGKTVSFLADSITTWSDPDGTRWIPDGYKCWYGNGSATNQEGGNTHSASGINDINKTWWKQVLNTLGMKLCVNASWSGSRVTGSSTDTSGSVGCGDGRINALTVKSGVKSECPVGTTPDIIIVFIGINDFGLSNIQPGTWDFKSLPAEGSQATFDVAYATCIKKIMTTYPNAEVFCCTLLETTSSYDKASGWPTNNNNCTLKDYNDKIRAIAQLFGTNIIDLHACGLTYFNCTSNCMDNIHPNVNGAKMMARKAVADICAQSRYGVKSLQ
jgi:lysophospholipase L1-like esterase